VSYLRRLDQTALNWEILVTVGLPIACVKSGRRVADERDVNSIATLRYSAGEESY
jgi:hypothetical protein